MLRLQAGQVSRQSGHGMHQAWDDSADHQYGLRSEWDIAYASHVAGQLQSNMTYATASPSGPRIPHWLCERQIDYRPESNCWVLFRFAAAVEYWSLLLVPLQGDAASFTYLRMDRPSAHGWRPHHRILPYVGPAGLRFMEAFYRLAGSAQSHLIHFLSPGSFP